MADVSELHQEARELSVRHFNELISQQFALTCHLSKHTFHRPPDDRPDRRRSLIGRFIPDIQQLLAEEPLNTSYKSAIIGIHKMRSELPLKATHQNCLMADRRPLLQPNILCQGRQELFWHNCAPVTAESLVSTWIESTRQRATIVTTVVSRLMTPTIFSTALRSRPHRK